MRACVRKCVRVFMRGQDRKCLSQEGSGVFLFRVWQRAALGLHGVSSLTPHVQSLTLVKSIPVVPEDVYPTLRCALTALHWLAERSMGSLTLLLLYL